MKGFAAIAAGLLALTVGFIGIATASDGPNQAVAAQHKKKHKTKHRKKCKKGKVFSRGKCRGVKVPGLSPPSPHSIVRATLSWDGPAYLGMQVTGQEGRAGYFPDEGGVLNEIPNAHYSRGTGGPGPQTETFTDDLFSGGYGAVPIPNGNRGFAFGYCYQGSAGPELSHVSYTCDVVGACEPPVVDDRPDRPRYHALRHLQQLAPVAQLTRRRTLRRP